MEPQARETAHTFSNAPERTLSKADTYENAAVTNTWLDHITPFRARQQDADNQVLGHMRMLIMPGAWHSDGFTAEPFASAVEAIVSQTMRRVPTPSRREGFSPYFASPGWL